MATAGSSSSESLELDTTGIPATVRIERAAGCHSGEALQERAHGMSSCREYAPRARERDRAHVRSLRQSHASSATQSNAPEPPAGPPCWLALQLAGSKRSAAMPTQADTRAKNPWRSTQRVYWTRAMVCAARRQQQRQQLGSGSGSGRAHLRRGVQQRAGCLPECNGRQKLALLVKGRSVTLCTGTVGIQYQ